MDRVVDLQFGSGEATHHLIVELYDRVSILLLMILLCWFIVSCVVKGNVILTDHTYTILSLLRMRTDADTDVRFATRETFSMDTVKKDQPMPTEIQ